VPAPNVESRKSLLPKVIVRTSKIEVR